MSNRRFVVTLLISNVLVALVVLAVGPFLQNYPPVSWLYNRTFDGGSTSDANGADVDYWTCSMHPSVKMTEPGKCPICGMDLTPVHRSAMEHGSGEAAVSAGAPVLAIDPHRLQMINVQTCTVETRHLERTIRAVGTLQLPDDQVYHVHARVSGWIDEVFVGSDHTYVEKGDPLFSIYSPELVASQKEFLLAMRTAEELSSSPFEHVSRGARSLLEASRKRLELFDVPPERIRELERTGEIQTSVMVHSPVRGHVIERNAFENLYVTPETNVYTLADHTRLWAQVEVYENELPLIRKGQSVTLTSESFPGREFHARVEFIYPHLNPETRTATVRLVLSNPRLELKPEMFVRAELHSDLGRTLAVSGEAVIRTGVRNLVFLDQGEGRLELREVALGLTTADFFEITSGLQEGDRVVCQANFLIDAESKIRGVATSWETPRPSPDTGHRP